MVVQQEGFEYRPERPNASEFRSQKWGWTSSKPGGDRWALAGRDGGVVVVDGVGGWVGGVCVRMWGAGGGARKEGGGEQLAGVCSCRGSHAHVLCLIMLPPSRPPAGCWAELELDTLQGSSHGEGETLLWLSHLRSYAGMGAARAECVSGCTCNPTTLEGTWEQRVSLFYMTRFHVGGQPAGDD